MNRSRLYLIPLLVWAAAQTAPAQTSKVIALDEATIADVNAAFDADHLDRFACFQRYFAGCDRLIFYDAVLH